MRNRFLTLLVLMLSSVYSHASMADEELEVVVDRAWGLLLGDEVTMKADLSMMEQKINENSLPEIGQRYGLWLYLKNIKQTPEQLVFHYQVVNIPQQNTEIMSPTFDLKLDNEEWLTIPPVTLVIGPTLALSDFRKIAAKSDSQPTLISTVDDERKLTLFSIASILFLLMLALWHFGWKPKNRQPFAQAVHELSRLKWQRTVEPDQASRILHNAFNHTAGTVLVYGELEEFMQQHEWLSPLKQDIEQFYQQSANHFFARQPSDGPEPNHVKKLAKACRAKEMMA